MNSADPSLGSSAARPRAGGPPGAGAPSDAADAHPRRRPELWVIWAVFVVVIGQFGTFLVTNPRFRWNVVAEYLFADPIIQGLMTTLLLTAIGMTIGVTIGTLVCLARISDYRPLRLFAQGWIALFRSVPPLVQLLFWFNLAYLLPELSIGIPFGPSFGSWNANDVISPFTAAVVGLSLYNSPYSAEIIRSGLVSVPDGQLEAARSLGLPWRDTFFRIRLPQATRVILPPMGSQAIQMLKGTSLVSVIAMKDLLGSAQTIYSANFEIIPLLMVAILWYVTVVALLTVGQGWLERRFSRGYVR